MSLYERFLELEKNDNSYYYNSIKYKEPITSPNNAWDFIKSYFMAGEKESALKENDIEKLKRNGKHLHTVSMYFMGILLRSMFEDKIVNKLNILFDNYDCTYRYDYTYTWFITCLFHDFSWIHEDEKILNKYKDADSCFRTNLINKYNIKHNIFDHKLAQGDDFKTHYKKRTIIDYFHYRWEFCKRADHGIIAGMLLYDRLVENYYIKWKEFEESNPEHEENSNCFNYKERAWRREHLDHFAYIADSIISHNIWFGIDDIIYRKYHLEEILQTNSVKVSIFENPLLFMLGVLDTIEPIKFFSTFSPEYIWNNIDIESKDSNITINIAECAILNYSEWFKKIESLSEWLCVTTCIDKRKVEIITV